MTLACTPLLAAMDSADFYPPRARYVIHKVGEEYGLGTASTNCLFQDNEGFLWLGTDTGVYRYDGTRFVHFGPEAGLPRDEVLQILQSTDKRLWVVTTESLFYRSGLKFLKVALPPQVKEFAAHQPLAADRLGRIFAATNAGLLLVTTEESPHATLLAFAARERPAAVAAVSPGSNQRIWLARGGRVGWIAEDLQVHFLPRQEVLPSPIIAVFEDAQGTLWVRTDRRLLRLNRGARQFVVELSSLPPSNLRGAPSTSRDGRVMVPTVDGLYLRRETSWEIVTKRSGLPSNTVSWVMEDREGTFWVGTVGNGLAQWQSNRMWAAWTDTEGLPDNVVWATHRDRRDRLWIGTNNGLALWSPALKRFRILRTKDGMIGPSAIQIQEAPDGAIWVLSRQEGLTRFDPDTLHTEKIVIPGGQVRFFAPALDGRFWFVGRNFVKTLRSWKAPFGFSEVKLPPAVQGDIGNFSVAQGVLWMGGEQGLARFDGKNWSVFGEKDGLQKSGLLKVLAVGRDEVWFGYHLDMGLTHFRLENGVPQVRHFNERNGLPFDGIYMLGRDSRGYIYAGGAQGLSRIAPDGSFRHFTHADGLLWDDIDEGAFFLEKDGSMLIGTSAGLARMDPFSSSTRFSADPHVIFTSVLLGGRERIADPAVRASYRENTLRAEFALLSYRNSSDASCWYRLKGVEGEYTKAVHHEVHYAALPPGEYALDVFCKSGEGLQSDPASFPFEIQPAWWQRWWARFFYLLLAGAAFYGLLRFRTYRLEEDRRQLEIAVEERSAELAQAIKELEEASITDALTGAHNRRFFQKSIEAGVRQTLRLYAENRREGSESNRDLIFYLIDADFFKTVNDRFGHDAGDEILVEMTRRIKSAIRQSDDLIRWGGEEFLVVSRYTNRSEASTLASRVLHAIGSQPFHVKTGGAPVWITCSVGWSAFPWFPANPLIVRYQTVLELADRALYRAKGSGRNCSIGLIASGVQGGGEQTSLTPDNLSAEELRLSGPRTPAAPAGNP